MSDKLQKSYFPALTGVRSLAATLVFVTHFGYVLTAGFPGPVQRYISELSIGLPMFFLLTGFLIALRYYDKFTFSYEWTKKYMISRFVRLYPMYLLFTVIAFVSYYFTHTESIVGGSKHPLFIFFLNITFLRSFFDDFKFTGVGQGWSITIDVVFYLLTPFIFYLIKQRKILYIQPFVFVFIGFLLVLLFRNFNLSGFFSTFSFTFYFTFFGRCFEIFMGIILALNYKKIPVNPDNKIKFTYIGFLLMLGGVWLIAQIPITGHIYEAFGMESPAGIIINNCLLVPAIAIFFFGLIKEETVFKKILTTNFVQLLSNSSFVFYLIHLGCIHDFLNAGVNWLNDWTFNFYDAHGLDWHSPFEYDRLNILYIFIALYGISIVAYRFLEEPINHRLRNWLFLKLTKAQKLHIVTGSVLVDAEKETTLIET